MLTRVKIEQRPHCLPESCLKREREKDKDRMGRGTGKRDLQKYNGPCKYK